MSNDDDSGLIKAVYSALVTMMVGILMSPITWGIKVLITVVVLRWMGVDI